MKIFSLNTADSVYKEAVDQLANQSLWPIRLVVRFPVYLHAKVSLDKTDTQQHHHPPAAAQQWINKVVQI